VQRVPGLGLSIVRSTWGAAAGTPTVSPWGLSRSPQGRGHKRVEGFWVDWADKGVGSKYVWLVAGPTAAPGCG